MKTKIAQCTDCGVDVEISVFASPAKAKCPNHAGPKVPRKKKPAPKAPEPLASEPPAPEPPVSEPSASGPPIKLVPWMGVTGWVIPAGWSGTLSDGQDVVNGVIVTADDATEPVQDEPAPAAPEVRGSMKEKRDAKLHEAKPFTPHPFALRQSMITSYLQCPDKMYDTYENGYSEDTVFTKVGTAVHGVMEDYFNAMDAGATQEELQALVPVLFHKWWTQHAVPEWDWYEEWDGLIKDYFDRHAGRQRPQIIATELQFGGADMPIVIDVNVGGRIVSVPVSGTIDRIDRIDERTICIRDYKSNMQPFSKDDLEGSIQFSYYSLVAHYLKPVIGDFDTVLCTYDMLRLGYEQHTSRTVETLATFAQWVAMIWEKILAGADRAPKLNQYCAFCQKRAGCSLYQSVLSGGYQPIITETTEVGRLDEERTQLAQMAKVIEKRGAEIDTMLKEMIQQGGGTIDCGEFEYKMTSQSMYTYPAKDIFRILAMNGMSDQIADIVSVGSTKLKDLMKGNRQLADQIEAIKVQDYKRPSLTKSKKKVTRDAGSDTQP